MYIDFMDVDGKITEKELFRRWSSLCQSPGYQSLENIRVNFKHVFSARLGSFPY